MVYRTPLLNGGIIAYQAAATVEDVICWEEDLCLPVRHEEIAICNATILAAVTSDDRCYFSPRHVCEALGVTWQGQHVKIMADQVLARTVKEIVTVAADGKQRNQTMLPIEFLSGWLFTIKKVRPEVQDKLNVFRAEGFVALDAWFRKGLRHSPSVADMLSRWAW